MMATLATFTSAIPASSGGTSSPITIEKRDCPYPGGQTQCLNQQNLACRFSCSGRPRDVAICAHECMASSTKFCLELRC